MSWKNMFWRWISDAIMEGFEMQKKECRIILVAEYESPVFREKESRMRGKMDPKRFQIELWVLRDLIFEFGKVV